MLRKKMAAVLGMAWLVVLMLSTAVAASFDWQSREGTINWAKGLADGTHVYLDAVRISKIRAQQTPAYIVISECFAQDKLIVFTQASPLLRIGQTVDIEGDLITLESGEHALTNVTVWGYCASDSTLLYFGPLIKGLLRPIPWQWKTNLTEQTALESITSTESMTTGEVSTESESTPIVYSTIAAAKSAGVGAVVELHCHPVSNCTLYSNTSGGVRISNTGAALGYNTIRNNGGSGIYLSSSGGNIYNNYIKSNSKGITTNSSNAVIDSNRIEYNSSGGLNISNATSVTITNNFIRGNSATNGGAIYSYFAKIFVFNNTIVSNSCSYKGAGIYVRNNDKQNAYIYNNIIASNTGSAALYLDNVGLNYTYAVNNGRNCFYNNDTNFTYTGLKASFYTNPDNISNSPGLATDGYHLAAGSACINAGTASATDKDGSNWVVYANTDIDGDSRQSSSVDIGCDEFMP